MLTRSLEVLSKCSESLVTSFHTKSEHKPAMYVLVIRRRMTLVTPWRTYILDISFPSYHRMRPSFLTPTSGSVLVNVPSIEIRNLTWRSMAASLPHLNLNGTLGTLTIAIILSTTLYGATCAQIIHYYNHYTRHDGGFVRSLVFIMWMLDTVVSASDVCSLWYYLITSHADPRRIELVPRVYDVRVPLGFPTT